MATSSLLGGSSAERQHSGTGTDLLGPSDSTDSGSDSIGTMGTDEFDGSDSDRNGTGERSDVEGDEGGGAADILPDRVAGPAYDLPGGGLDEVADLAQDEDSEDDEPDAA